MKRLRIIPCLLLRGSGLVKTKKFGSPRYLGDAINTLKIFNDKRVDEIVVLDIEASKQKREPNYTLIEKLAGECFMPLCYGGGVSSVAQMEKLYKLGCEKISLNHAASSELVTAASERFGSQSVVVCIDVKKDWRGRLKVYDHVKDHFLSTPVIEWAQQVADAGAGEIVLQSVERDGMKGGYDEPFIKDLCSRVSVPVIALGGASSAADMASVIVNSGASAASAGSLFVFEGKHDAVLINVPDFSRLKQA